MDHGLITWARQVKQRTRTPYPTLWLFTDEAVLANPLSAIARLPRHICGVVYRHDAAPNRAALGRAIAKLCRQRRITLAVAGDSRLAAALNAGVHLRDGIWPGLRRPTGLITSSAHTALTVCNARRAGAAIIFISPAFCSASHPGQPALGSIRWRHLARLAGPASACALGGISGQKIKMLAQQCCAAASIRALSGNLS
jgi:thiamine-phosphate pyrophosphorylase